MTLGNTYENHALNLMLGVGRSTLFPDPLYLALFTVVTSDAGGGTEISTSGTGYARLAVANSAVNWGAASSGSKANLLQITFAVATGSWGTVVGWAFMDSSSVGSGNVVMHGPVAPQLVVAGDAPYFAPGALTIAVD